MSFFVLRTKKINSEINVIGSINHNYRINHPNNADKLFMFTFIVGAAGVVFESLYMLNVITDKKVKSFVAFAKRF